MKWKVLALVAPLAMWWAYTINLLGFKQLVNIAIEWWSTLGLQVQAVVVVTAIIILLLTVLPGWLSPGVTVQDSFSRSKQ